MRLLSKKLPWLTGVYEEASGVNLLGLSAAES